MFVDALIASLLFGFAVSCLCMIPRLATKTEEKTTDYSRGFVDYGKPFRKP